MFCVGLLLGFTADSLRAAASVLKSDESVKVGESTRFYTISRPAVLREGRHYPLIIAFHGNRSEVKLWFHDYTAFDDFIPEKEFIIVYPEGPIHWEADVRGRDLPFFDALVAQLEKKYPVDASRIYAIGHSNGAGFATFLLFTRPDVIAAVAAHSGIYPPGYHGLPVPKHKAPLFVIWGEKDEFSPAGSEAVQSSIGAFSKAGFHVETFVLPNWGHSWGGRANQTEEKVLSFLFRYSLPE
jgi:poly(3-hydroxybutyrate) depolymerase